MSGATIRGWERGRGDREVGGGGKRGGGREREGWPRKVVRGRVHQNEILVPKPKPPPE